MGVTINVIPPSSSQFAQDIGDWEGAGSVLSRSTDVVDPNTGKPTLSVYNNSGVALAKYLTHDFAVLNDEVVPWPLRATARVKPTENSQVVVYLTTVVGGASSTVSASATVIANEWQLVSVETAPISVNTSHVEYGIYFTDTSDTTPAYIGNPSIISPWAVVYNTMARETWIRLPEYICDADLSRTELDRPLLRFIDVITSVAGQIYDTWSQYRWIPPEENNKSIKESELVTPSAVPPGREDILRWLVQIVGAKIVDPSTGLTPWQNLDFDDNPATNDATWNLFTTGSPLDIAPTDSVVSWLEIQNYDTVITNLDEFLRWQINSAAYGFRAGTKESIIDAAKQALSGNQTVTFVPHYNNDVWHIALYINSAEGDTTEVTDTVLPAMPAGFELTVLTS